MAKENSGIDRERLIVGDIMTSRAPMENLAVLCDELGSRFAGTPAERAAAEFLAQRFEEYGLERVALEPYQYTGWSRGEATLRIVEPIERTVPCISLPYCPPAARTGVLVDVGMGVPEDFARTADKLPGAIVMANNQSPPRLGRWIHRKEKYVRAVAAGAAAFLYVGGAPGLGPETGSLRDDGEGEIPGVSVSLEDAAFLQRLLKRAARVRIGIETTDRIERRQSWNVVGELRGTREPDIVTMLGCHYDGHDIAQGAIDPASGMVVVLEIARVLARQARGSMPTTVRFAAWGTEELGLIGSHRYVEQHSAELDAVRFYLNLDSAGSAGRKGVVLHHWPEMEPFFRDALWEMAVDAPVGEHVSPSSDHFPFWLAGVPTAGLGDPEAAPTGRGFGHTRHDTMDKVHLGDLHQASSVAARLALRLASAPELPARRRSRAAIEELIRTEPNLEGYRVSEALERELASKSR